MIKDAQRTVRQCDHCSVEYMPSGNRQRFCLDCLGPAIETRWGLRYLGGNRLRRYGVSYSEWLVLRDRYQGLCWICKDSDATEVDHCHQTAQTRGALCRECNTSLHYVERDGWLAAAHEYLAVSF